MKNLSKLVVFGFFALGAACGDDDGGSGAVDVDSGVPEATPLGDVTPAQVEQVCDAVENAVNSRFSAERQARVACELLGALISANPGSCRDFVDQCVSDPPGELEMMGELPGGDEIAEAGCIEGNDLEGCTATVGELETCLNDQVDVLEGLLDQFSCANAGNLEIEDLPETESEIPMADSCAALEMECPGALGAQTTPQ